MGKQGVSLSIEDISTYKNSLQKLSKKELIALLLSQKDIQIPVTVFSSDVSPLTALVKYLHDEKKLSIKEISIRLNRHLQTIWTIYRKSKGKKLKITPTDYFVPLPLFAKERFSILETIIPYLKKTYDLSISEIALILDKNIKTIWTCYARFRKKGGEK
jgi:hypothetical protein